MRCLNLEKKKPKHSAREREREKNNLHANQTLSSPSLYATFADKIAFICTKAFNYCSCGSTFSHAGIFYLEMQTHVHLIGSHSVPQLCERSLPVCQLEEMAACISAWNKAPVPKWQVRDIVGKWMLNSLCNHQQQSLLWKINCTLAKGKGNCFGRYTTKSRLWAIHLSDLFAKKVL